MLGSQVAAAKAVLFRWRVGVNRDDGRILMTAPGTTVGCHISTLVHQNIIVTQGRNIDGVGVAAGTGVDGVTRRQTGGLRGGLGVAVLMPGITVATPCAGVQITAQNVVMTQGIHYVVYIAFTASAGVGGVTCCGAGRCCSGGGVAV